MPVGLQNSSIAKGLTKIHLDKEVDVGARMFEPCTSDQNEATGKSTTSGDHATEHGISAAQARFFRRHPSGIASADSAEPTC